MHREGFSHRFLLSINQDTLAFWGEIILQACVHLASIRKSKHLQKPSSARYA